MRIYKKNIMITPNKNPPFKTINLRNPNNWQRIRFIAKSNLPDDMEKKNAIGAYCTIWKN